ncbi:MAG: peptide chain release factor N(5)-glutamine methyltransferase [Dehalococcoidales bacterium]|nr:peptide chain release factor N(5)-glutamine methyltransferase [Dehalococcoidales bacterium]
MRRRELLTRAHKLLAANHILDSQLEAEVLLRHVLHVTRLQLIAEIDLEVPVALELEYALLVARRLNGEPTAYITGHREFYGLDFTVNPAVLIPRPETELLVEKTIKCAVHYPAPVIADIGTGSGAIAVALAVHLPKAQIVAVDISPEALAIPVKTQKRMA